ncbi:MAG: transposase [Puniceicoccales bacterium]|jgi:hypothetical protein|nr:transposase [Puniceicoccales bacterium]
MQEFQDILPRSKRKIFRTIFPQNAKLFLLYETDKTTGEDVSFYWKGKAEQRYFLHRFNAASPMQNASHWNHKTFKNMANWTHSSISTAFGLKLHLVPDASRKFVRFSLKPGNLHDVACMEEVLAGCMGTVIGEGDMFLLPSEIPWQKGNTVH